MWTPVLFVLSLGLIQNAGMAVILTHRLPTDQDPIELIVATLVGMLPLFSGIYTLARVRKLKIPYERRVFISRFLLTMSIVLSLSMQYMGWKQYRANAESKLVFLFFPFYAFMFHMMFSQVVLAFYKE